MSAIIHSVLYVQCKTTGICAVLGIHDPNPDPSLNAFQTLCILFFQHIPIKICQHHKAVAVHSNEDLYNIFIKCTYDILIQSLGG